MRIALIHNWTSSSDVSDRVWSALCRTWPQADRFTSDPWQSTDTSHWLAAAPRRVQLMGLSTGRHEQLLSRLTRDHDTNTALLGGYDLIVSTSPAAARLVSSSTDAVHSCFMGTEAAFQPAQTTFAPALATKAIPSELAPAQGRPRLWAQHETEQFPSDAGVTHYLATTHAVAAQYHFELAGKPHVTLYPSIDTTFFRPGPEAHQNFYLMVCHPGVATDVGLVIEACEKTRRELVILGGDSLRQEIGPVSGTVRWEALPDDTTLRSYYRRCRALISVAPTGFDPSLVEAQACGTPVIAYHGSATDELVLDAERSGLGTGLFFHTMSSNSLVSALHELERRPQNISAVLSLAQAEKFSPAHFEHGLLNHVSRWLSNRAAQLAIAAKATLPITTPLDSPIVPRRRAA
ncbi:MAG: mshA 6 [Planctomycetaceae bacterium]|nr:mshA 6 [Planctomycetaceae bacterium]